MISIIIPVYNEANNIGQLISYLVANGNHCISEIIVSDGGSTDATIEAAKMSGAKTVVSPKKGRAAQMNFGASIATGEILYFVHADTFPSLAFSADITSAVAKNFQLGRYQTQFDSNKIVLKINAFFTRFDWFICYGGDQTFFITKQLFTRINGFKEDMLIMEDYDIVVRAKQYGRYKILAGKALISARKYEANSWLKVQNANRTIVSMYKKGASQQAMINKYKQMLILK